MKTKIRVIINALIGFSLMGLAVYIPIKFSSDYTHLNMVWLIYLIPMIFTGGYFISLSIADSLEIVFKKLDDFTHKIK